MSLFFLPISARRIRLHRQPVDEIHQPPGDQLAVLRIVNPPADSEAARELFKRMEQELAFDPRPHWRK